MRRGVVASTGIIRSKRLVVLVGQKKTVAITVRNDRFPLNSLLKFLPNAEALACTTNSIKEIICLRVYQYRVGRRVHEFCRLPETRLYSLCNRLDPVCWYLRSSLLFGPPAGDFRVPRS